jgi:glutamate synthase (NADPH/NADH) small chain
MSISSMRRSKVRWVSQGGRSRMELIEGSEERREALMVLIATGYDGPERTLIDALALSTTARNTVKSPAGTYSTSAHAVFTAGDMHRGQSLVVWAIHEGREAARECHDFLRKRD